MKHNLLENFSLFRDIFGVCPHCQGIFRLSQCHIYLKERPPGDWFDKLDVAERTLSEAEERLKEKEKQMKEALYSKWRRRTQKQLAKIDPVFSAKKLQADDAKVISHPVDFIVFNGMNSADKIKNVILLDSKKKFSAVQKSVEKAVEKEHYDWATFRISEDGKVEEE